MDGHAGDGNLTFSVDGLHFSFGFPLSISFGFPLCRLADEKILIMWVLIFYSHIDAMGVSCFVFSSWCACYVCVFSCVSDPNFVLTGDQGFEGGGHRGGAGQPQYRHGADVQKLGRSFSGQDVLPARHARGIFTIFTFTV